MLKLFRSVSIAKGLYAMSGVAVLLILLEFFVGYFFINHFLLGFTDIYGSNNQIQEIHKIRQYAEEMGKTMESTTLAKAELSSLQESFLSHHEKAGKLLENLAARFQREVKVSPGLQSARQAHQQMREFALKYFVTLQKKNPEEGDGALLESSLLAVGQFRLELEESLAKVSIVLNRDMTESFARLYADRNEPIYFMLAFGALAALLFLFLSWSTVKRIHLSLNNLKNLASAAAEGNLELRAKILHDDEIGNLTAEFNHMIDNLSSARTLLEEKNRELENFSYVASHDLQEPLRKIMAYGEILMTEHAGQLDREGLDTIEIIKRAATRMKDLINAILDYSRLAHSREPMIRIDLQHLIQEVCADLEVSIKNSNARVDLVSLPMIQGYPVQIRQLFQNLISNAIKFARDGVPPHIAIKGLGGDSKGTEILVEDNGIGFDSKYKERIFLPFKRLHTQEKYRGTGVGLAICKKIVQNHGGDITAQSEPGRGTRIFIKLAA